MANITTSKRRKNSKRFVLADKILTDKTKSFSNFRLDSNRRFISIDMCTTTLKKVQMPNPMTGKMSTYIDKNKCVKETTVLSFPLRELTVNQIQILRKKLVPAFILKEKDKFYYAIIPRNISFLTADFLGGHLCASLEKGCRRHQPANSEKEGCKKVFDLKKQIENYDFIEVGFETINVSQEVFSVVKCKRYMCEQYKQPKSKAI